MISSSSASRRSTCCLFENVIRLMIGWLSIERWRREFDILRRPRSHDFTTYLVSCYIFVLSIPHFSVNCTFSDYL